MMKVIKSLEATYWKMRVSQEDKHKKLCMNLGYSDPGQWKLYMINNLEGVLEQLYKVKEGRILSPVYTCLFNVHKNLQRLD